MKNRIAQLGLVAAVLAGGIYAPSIAAQTNIDASTTAWRNGAFHTDVAGVIGRSDIVLGQPNTHNNQAMPLGNGRLGVALWSADGLTAQLNRSDTMPYRYSPGQLIVPGLATLTTAKDYSGRLDLYNGEFREHGGGMTATAFVDPVSDTLVLDVTGANPAVAQTAYLKLWAPRTPHASVAGSIGILSETWSDDKDPGASGLTFGSLAAITAQGQNVSVTVTDPRTIAITFRPAPDGHFRILVAAPHYDGHQDARSTAEQALSVKYPDTHRLWWNAFWHRAGIIKITSSDGSGEYIENLRTLFLFTSAAESGSKYPGSQAGIADMFSSVRDVHAWDPAAYWQWNLRMQVAANIGAGLPESNIPYFNLYLDNLANIEKWTRQYMGGRPGACVPETMRFNGQGIEYEALWVPHSIGRDCDAGFEPYYNARTLSTGAEVSLWVWQQFLVTGDRKFLATYYPIMAASARFLLAYGKPGPDGMLHTSPSNAHETQWDTTDPTTDIAAQLALYPATIQAAKLLHKDAALILQMQAALPKIPPFPRTDLAGKHTLLPASADSAAQDVIADSYLPSAPRHNVENIGLEPVWPYNLIGDTSPLFSLAQRTYWHRPFPVTEDWSFDPIQAARLNLGDEVRTTLVQLAGKYQTFINGFSNWGGTTGEFYIEMNGIVATALQEALVQDYDGLIRIAPAIPHGWDFDGSVYVRGKTKVDVQTRSGIPTTVAIEAGTTGALRVRNPWPGQSVHVVATHTGKTITGDTVGPVLRFHAVAGNSYLLERSGMPIASLPFTPISGAVATTAKKLGPVQLGLFPKQ